MSVEWEKAPQDVIELAERLIEEHHPNLVNARIGILFRDKAPKSGGRLEMGKASKVSDKWKPLLREELDFIIWRAADILSPAPR